MTRKLMNPDGMPATRFGTQPVYDKIVGDGWTMQSLVAKLHGVTRYKVHRTMHGYQAPDQKTRDELSRVLGYPITELFTAESLASKPPKRGGVYNTVHYAKAVTS